MSELVTLIDIARHASVSRATASLVLRDSPLIAAPTKARVQRSLEAVSYLYSRGAATMRATRTKTIGLLVNQIDNPFFAELTDGASSVNAEMVRRGAGTGVSAPAPQHGHQEWPGSRDLVVQQIPEIAARPAPRIARRGAPE